MRFKYLFPEEDFNLSNEPEMYRVSQLGYMITHLVLSLLTALLASIGASYVYVLQGI
jgi:hypothetical protein